MVGMVTECNHPMHWRPDLFAFLRNGQAIIRRTINRSWGNFKVESVRDRFGINVPPFTGSRAGVFFPSKWWVWTIFKQARSSRMVYRISMAFQQLCLLFAVVLKQLACGVFDYHSRQDTSLVKWENLVKAGVEAEEAVEAHREKVERRVGKNRVLHHRPKRREKWTCWAPTQCRMAITSLIMCRSFWSLEDLDGTQEERKERRKRRAKEKRRNNQ